MVFRGVVPVDGGLAPPFARIPVDQPVDFELPVDGGAAVSKRRIDKFDIQHRAIQQAMTE